MAEIDIANAKFTFWGNMKEAIEVYTDEKFKYKLYDALTEYALYGIWPEDEGTVESQTIISFVQSLVPSLDKSRGYFEKSTEGAVIGGRRQKITDEQLREGIAAAACAKGSVPTRPEIVQKIYELYGVKIDPKTISRRIPDSEKQSIAITAINEKKAPPATFGF